MQHAIVRSGTLFAAVHLVVWLALFALCEPVPREYLTKDPVAVEGPTMHLNLTTDRGILMFARPYGGRSDGLLVRIAMLPNLPALAVATFVRDQVDWSTPYDEYELSFVTGVTFLLASTAFWFGVGAIVALGRKPATPAAV